MDWIGFLISAAALIYLFFKNQTTIRTREALGTSPISETIENQSHLPFKPLKPMPPRKALPKQKRYVSEDEHRELVSPLKKRHVKSTLLSTHDQETATGPSRAKILINRLHHKQNLLVYSEIFGKPKGL